VRLSGGPIVEQCTHFADLARFIAGEVKLDTLTAIAIGAPSSDNDHAGPGFLSLLPNDVVSGKSVEAGLPAEFRVPRLTAAHWRFESGLTTTQLSFHILSNILTNISVYMLCIYIYI
jgi:predicted dehydrogenase